MNAERMIDAGTSTTLHDRLNGHVQTGDTVQAMVGDEKNWEWAEGVVVGWRGDGAERKPRVLFTFVNGCKLEKIMAVDALRPVGKFDPSRNRTHSEMQFSPTMSEAEYQRAIGNDDLCWAHSE